MSDKKPAAIRRLEGNPGKRALPKNEVPNVTVPEPPAHLTPEQLGRWQDIVGSLPVELLSRADDQVLERMAVAWATFRHTTTLINQAGLLTRGQNGEPVYNPLLRVRTAATDGNGSVQPCARAFAIGAHPADGAGPGGHRPVVGSARTAWQGMGQ